MACTSVQSTRHPSHTSPTQTPPFLGPLRAYSTISVVPRDSFWWIDARSAPSESSMTHRFKRLNKHGFFKDISVFKQRLSSAKNA